MSPKDIELLLEKAIESKRDLTVIINTDGTIEVNFNIPQKTKTTMVHGPESAAAGCGNQ